MWILTRKNAIELLRETRANAYSWRIVNAYFEDHELLSYPALLDLIGEYPG